MRSVRVNPRSPSVSNRALRRSGVDDDVDVAHHARRRSAVQGGDQADAFERARGHVGCVERAERLRSAMYEERGLRGSGDRRALDLLVGPGPEADAAGDTRSCAGRPATPSASRASSSPRSATRTASAALPADARRRRGTRSNNDRRRLGRSAGTEVHLHDRAGVTSGGPSSISPSTYPGVATQPIGHGRVPPRSGCARSARPGVDEAVERERPDVAAVASPQPREPKPRVAQSDDPRPRREHVGHLRRAVARSEAR